MNNVEKIYKTVDSRAYMVRLSFYGSVSQLARAICIMRQYTDNVDGSSPSGTAKGKTQSFPSFIFIPPIYDHSQIRITHEVMVAAPTLCAAVQF